MVEKQSEESETSDTDTKKPKMAEITVNLGNEEYNHGKMDITNEIFEGKDKTENAELFIDNLQKTKQRHIDSPE